MGTQSKVHDFREIYNNRYKIAQRVKQDGQKIIGYFSDYIPEEIMYAGGVLPVWVTGGGSTVTEATSYLPSFFCPYFRDAFEAGLKGKYSYLDGIVISRTCDPARHIYSLWTSNIKTAYSHFLALPSKNSPEAVSCLKNELERFKNSLENYTSKKISTQNLESAIHIYNENRSLLRQLYELGLDDNPPLLGSEVFQITRAGFVISKEEHNHMLRQLLSNLPSSGNKDKTRVLFSGCVIDDISILKTTEELGGNVVTDDTCSGLRYFWGDVATNSEPLEALAFRYLNKIPAPYKYPPDRRIDNLVKMAQRYNVKGVISVVRKFCDNYAFEGPFLKQRLEAEGIPLLSLEVDQIGESSGQLKTRIEAFLEVIR